jgi:hypothetical protein
MTHVLQGLTSQRPLNPFNSFSWFTEVNCHEFVIGHLFKKSVKGISMRATAQPLPEVPLVSLHLNPPVRAESIDLRAISRQPC